MTSVLSIRRAFLVLCGLLAVLAALPGSAVPAYAHGEKAQDAFSRMETVGWWGVQFSQSSVEQGQEVTITGTAKILESWPNNLSNGNPEICYLTVVEPGAQFTLRGRVVNGVQAPQSFYCHKGGVYNFKLTLAGRSPGDWHVHPGLAVREAGTLIGPGQWIHISASPAGYSNLVQLLNGQTIDLESYSQWFVVGFSLLTFVLGMWWMIKWTWSKPTITRLAVANELPLNQDGGDAVGLITRRDHVHSAIIAGITALVLAAGLLYQQLAFKNTLPPQSDWVTIPSAAQPKQLASVEATSATYDPPTHIMTLALKVTNTSNDPVQVAAFRTSYLAFWDRSALPSTTGPYDHEMSVSQGTIGPGQTRDVTLTLPGQVLEAEKLVPIGKAQMQVAGVVQLTNESGALNFDTVLTGLNLVRL